MVLQNVLIIRFSQSRIVIRKGMTSFKLYSIMRQIAFSRLTKLFTTLKDMKYGFNIKGQHIVNLTKIKCLQDFQKGFNYFHNLMPHLLTLKVEFNIKKGQMSRLVHHTCCHQDSNKE